MSIDSKLEVWSRRSSIDEVQNVKTSKFDQSRLSPGKSTSRLYSYTAREHQRTER